MHIKTKIKKRIHVHSQIFYVTFTVRTAVDVLSRAFQTRPGDMKVSSSVYKGIQYVQVSTLPVEQRERLLVTINKELFIKILVDGKIIGNCLQFKDYEWWFESVYKPVGVNGERSETAKAEAELVQLEPGSSN